MKKEDCDFGIVMGGLDSVEVCELVSIFLFNQMENVLPQELLELFMMMALAPLIYLFQHWTGSERRLSECSKCKEMA